MHNSRFLKPQPRSLDGIATTARRILYPPNTTTTTIGAVVRTRKAFVLVFWKPRLLVVGSTTNNRIRYAFGHSFISPRAGFQKKEEDSPTEMQLFTERICFQGFRFAQ